MGDNQDFMLGYLIGIRYSDGYIYYENFAGKDIFEIQAIDKSMVDYTSKCLNKLFNLKTTVKQASRKTRTGNIVWRMRTPAKLLKKALLLNNITNELHKKGFVSAFYDAEGNISKVSRAISMANTKRGLLNLVGNYIKELSGKRLNFNIKQYKRKKEHPTWKDCFKLNILKGYKGRRQHLNHNFFFELFSPQIQRKIIIL